MICADLYTEETDSNLLFLCNELQKLERYENRFRSLLYYHNNPDKCKKQSKKWYRKNGRKYHREYYRKNKK